MAFKIKDNLDLNGYILQNFCIDNYDSLDSISDKGLGRAVFLTGNATDGKYHHVNIYDGTGFRALAYLDEIANNAAFIALQEKVELLSGDVDTDAIISNMKEVSAFLSGFAEDASLMDLLNSKLDTSGGTMTGELTVPRINIKTHRLFINTSDEWIVTDAGWQTEYKLLHSGNFADQIGNYYLKTSGGTMASDSQISWGGGASGIWGTDNGLFLSAPLLQRRASGGIYYTILDSGNFSDYALPLTGGTINGPLTINTTLDRSLVLDEPTGEQYHVISFAAGGKEYALLCVDNLGTTNKLEFNNNIVIHTGNIGLYKAGDSDKLDGISPTSYLRREGQLTRNVDANELHDMKFYINTTGNGSGNENFPDKFGYFLNLCDSAVSDETYYKGVQISFGSGDVLQFRGHWEYAWQPWKTIAFTDSTVAAAKKLVTSEGTDALLVDNSKHIYTSGYLYSDMSGDSVTVLDYGSDGKLLLGYGIASAGLETHIYGNVVKLRGGKSHTVGLVLNESGNVTIGANDLAGTSTKLYVNGVAKFTSIENTGSISDYDNQTGYFVGKRNAGLGVTTGGLLLLSYGATPITLHTGGSERMCIAANGNVLIGTNQNNASGAKLQVNGDISLTTAILTDGQELLRRYADSLYIGYGTAVQGSLPTSIWGNEIRFINKSGQVKAYITDDGDLHVKGNIIADGEVSAGGVGEEGSAGAGSGSQMYATTIAEGTTTMDIAHGLATDDIVISIYEKDSTSGLWNMVLTDIEITDANNIRVTFGSATTVEHKVVIFGAVA